MGFRSKSGRLWEIQFAEDLACHAALKARPSGRVAFIPKNRRDVTRREVFPLDVEDVPQFAGEQFFILREIIWKQRFRSFSP